ncbi:hypothetical protein D1AOALGA4SA_1700 [Olavius algarvensis Delta 1 endosymbiont]|nr:hypothetical protein D1AOALGA4SA_1700 [Olavius algarvensis Delta 1 endosymbiont]
MIDFGVILNPHYYIYSIDFCNPEKIRITDQRCTLIFFYASKQIKKQQNYAEHKIKLSRSCRD